MKSNGPESENAGRDENIDRDDLGSDAAPQPALQAPVTAHPVAAYPVADQPVSAQPIMANHVPAQPVAAQPFTAPPIMAQPITAQPVIAKPVTVQPVHAQPASAQPVMARPVTARPSAAPQATVVLGTAQAAPQSRIAAPPEPGASPPFNGFIFEEDQTKLARFMDWLIFKKKVIGFITGLLIAVAAFFWSHPEIIGGSTNKIEVLASRLGGTWAINENNFRGKMIFTPDKKDPIFGNYWFFDNKGTPLAEDSYQVLHTSEKDYLELALTEDPEVFQITFKSRNEITLVTNDEISIDLTRDD